VKEVIGGVIGVVNKNIIGKNGAVHLLEEGKILGCVSNIISKVGKETVVDKFQQMDKNCSEIIKTLDPTKFKDNSSSFKPIWLSLLWNVPIFSYMFGKY